MTARARLSLPASTSFETFVLRTGSGDFALVAIDSTKCVLGRGGVVDDVVDGTVVGAVTGLVVGVALVGVRALPDVVDAFVEAVRVNRRTSRSSGLDHITR